MNSWQVGMITLFLAGGFFLSGCGDRATETPTGSATAPAIPKGQELFANHCAGCHAGGGNIADPGKPLKGSSKLASLNDFSVFLRNPGQAMPPFAPELISDEEVAELYQYVNTEYKK